MDIYRISHLNSGKCYVGSTIRTTERRFREHCTNALRGDRKSLLYDAIREYGVSAFAVETIATADLYEELLTLERDAIAANNCVVPHGFNVVQGGRGNYGWKMSDATRARIAARAKGRPAHNKGKKSSTEVKAKVSEAQRLRFLREQANGIVRVAWNKGIKAAPGVGAKISARLKGRPAPNKGVSPSEETRRKMSIANKGKLFTTSHRQALRDAQVLRRKNAKSGQLILFV